MGGYEWDFGLIWQYRWVFLQAAKTTMTIMIETIALALPVGFLLAMFRMSRFKVIRGMGRIWVEIARSIPPLVWLVWFYYCLPILIGLTMSATLTVVIALALYSGVYFAEIIRAGLQSVDRGQIEAGKAVGMTGLQILKRIAGPIAFMRIFPPFIGQCVLVLKFTTLASMVAVGELLYEAQRISIHTFRPMEILTVTAFCFAIIILPITVISTNWDDRLRRKYFGE